MSARCLVLSPRTPWPQDDGGRVVLWQDLLALAGGFHTRLAILQPPGRPRPDVPDELRRLGVEVTFVAHRFPPAPQALIQGVAGRWPYTLGRFHSRGAARAIGSIVATWNPDLVFINNLHLATYSENLGSTVKVLRQHNLEQLWLERYARSVRNPAVAAYAKFQALRMRGCEAMLCSAMDLILAMHGQEAAAMRALAPNVRVEAVPVSVALRDEPSRAPANVPTLLLIGSFDREANAEGAARFLREGWPRVRSSLPNARLRLVGRQIPGTLERLAREHRAEPVGYVADLAPEFARAWGVVIPVWQGAGIRVKMVEALAAGVPVACTPLGAEGLELAPGRHYLEAATGAALGDAALSMLLDPGAANVRANEARALVRERFERGAVARLTLDLCESGLAHAGHRRAGTR